jgi:hypothetical protein
LPPPPLNPRLALYVVVNLGFVLLVLLLNSVGGSPSPRLVYVISLFLLCSTWIIDIDGLNGRYALLALFLTAYFVSFGLLDFTNLLNGTTSEDSGSPFTGTETVILVGGIMFTLGYRITVASGSTALRRSIPRDWSMPAIVVVGLIMWVVGSIALYRWNVYIITDTTSEAAKKGLASLSGLGVATYILAQMVQPFGILLLAYAWRSLRSPYLLAVIVAVVVFQIVLGFIIDIKGVAMTGGILVIMTIVLVDGRIPIAWLAGAAAFVILAFPIFQASRTEVHGNRGIARAAIVQNLGETLKLAFSAKDRVNTGRGRAQTFFERASVRGSVQMIVQNTGNGVNFQHGYTLLPLLATFIPRLLWPDKPDVETGKLVNKEFHVSEYEATYISPSFLGELYWNFGWLGVVLGMALNGSLFGFIAGRFNLAEARTVTGLLVLVLTIKQLVVGFEGAIGPQYVVWLRSVAGVALLQLLFARMPARERPLSPAAMKDADPRVPVAFPNLMR